EKDVVAVRGRDAIENGAIDHVRMCAHELKRVLRAVRRAEKHHALVAKRTDEIREIGYRLERGEVARLHATPAQATRKPASLIAQRSKRLLAGLGRSVVEHA